MKIPIKMGDDCSEPPLVPFSDLLNIGNNLIDILQLVCYYLDVVDVIKFGLSCSKLKEIIEKIFPFNNIKIPIGQRFPIRLIRKCNILLSNEIQLNDKVFHSCNITINKDSIQLPFGLDIPKDCIVCLKDRKKSVYIKEGNGKNIIVVDSDEYSLMKHLPNSNLMIPVGKEEKFYMGSFIKIGDKYYDSASAADIVVRYIIDKMVPSITLIRALKVKLISFLKEKYSHKDGFDCVRNIVLPETMKMKPGNTERLWSGPTKFDCNPLAIMLIETTINGYECKGKEKVDYNKMMTSFGRKGYSWDYLYNLYTKMKLGSGPTKTKSSVIHHINELLPEKINVEELF